MAGTPAVPDMRLELVPLPVSDVDRAGAFYERAGFGNLHDTQVTETMRVVQLTPPGSSCAIVFGTGMGPVTDMVPGSVKGLHLVVEDMAVARAALAERGIGSAHRAGRGLRDTAFLRVSPGTHPSPPGGTRGEPAGQGSGPLAADAAAVTRRAGCCRPRLSGKSG